MKDGLGTGTLAEPRGSAGSQARGRVGGWAAGGTDTDRDPGSDWWVIKRVGALHHSTALG